MRILPIRDLSTRKVTGYDVFIQVLFNGNPPEAFDPSKYYTAGDLVYVVNEDGSLKIMQATISGTFPSATEPNFQEYNLTDVIAKQQEEIKRLTGIRSKISSTIYNTEALYYNVAKGQTTVSDIVLTNWNDADNNYAEVYVNGKFVSIDKWELTIAAPVDGCLDRNGTLTLDASLPVNSTNSVVIRLNRANSLITRMIRRYEAVTKVSHEQKTVVTSKNLLKPTAPTYDVASGITSATVDKDPASATYGQLTITGATAAGSTTDIYLYGSKDATENMDLPNLPSGWMTLSGNSTTVDYYFRFIDIDGTVKDVKDQVSRTIGTKVVGAFVRLQPDTVYTNQKINIQLEKGLDNTSWEKYSETVEEVYDDVKVPYPLDPNIVTLQYDLYINGVFIPSNEYAIDLDDDGETIIKEWPRTEGVLDYEFNFEFVYSVSNEVVLLKQDAEYTVKDGQQGFITNLTDVGFVNSFQELKVFNGNEVVDPGKYVTQKGRVNICEIQDYFNVGDKIKVSVWTYLLPDYIAGTVRHNSQTVPVIMDDTLRTPIPFIEWNEQTDDLLVFNDAGILLSSCKWYLDNGFMQYFQHDLGVDNGDILDFRLIDKDESIMMQNLYVDVTEDGQREFTLNGVDLSVFNFIMIFTTTGEYIPVAKYEIDTSDVDVSRIHGGDGVLTLSKGDRLEIIGFKYIDSMTTTSLSRRIVTPSKEDQVILANPFPDYDASTDSLLIFNNAGQYIGERFYTATPTTITLGTIVLGGSGVGVGEYLEVILVRNSSISTKVNINKELVTCKDVNLNDLYGSEVAARLMAFDLVKYGVLTPNDANLLRTSSKALEINATCNDETYPASIIFSGARCLLAIDTVDADGTEHIVSGNTVNVQITVKTSNSVKVYCFNILINPRDLTVVVLTPASTTGESMIVPELQRLLRCFTIPSLTGMTDDMIALIKECQDIRLSAEKDGVKLNPTMTTSLEGVPAICFGDIQTGGTITGQILLNFDDEDYLYKFTLIVTKPWQLEYKQIQVTSTRLDDLESSYLRLDALYGETKQFVTEGYNAIDMNRFESENGVVIDSVDPDTGSITITGSGVGTYQYIDIPMLDIVNSTGKYILALDSVETTNAKGGDGVCGFAIRHGDPEAPEWGYINIPEDSDDGKHIEISFEDFTNLLGINLRIYTNDTNVANIGKNTVRITGLRMHEYTEEPAVVLPFEPYTGLAPSPNPTFRQEIIPTGSKTYNVLDASKFEAVTSGGITIKYDEIAMDLVIDGTATTSAVTAEVNVDMADFIDDHIYKVFVNGPDETVTANLGIMMTTGESTTAGSVVYNSANIESIKAVVTIPANLEFANDANMHLHLMVVDTTDIGSGDATVVEFKPYGYEVVINVKSGNLFDFNRIGTKTDNGITFESIGDGTYRISGEKENDSLGATAYYDLTHAESKTIFEPGVYAVTSGDTDAGVNPLVFVSVFYDDAWHEVANSGAFTSFTITNILRDKSDFLVRIGFKVSENATPVARYMYPQLLRSANNGEDFKKRINGNGVLVQNFEVCAEKNVPIILRDCLYGRATRITNFFNPTWIPTRTTNGITVYNNTDGSIVVSGKRTNASTVVNVQKSFTHKESIDTFKPGYYLISSGDTTGNVAPYVYMEVLGKEAVEVVESTTSLTYNVIRITGEMYEDVNFVVNIGIKLDTTQVDPTNRTLWPMLLYTREDSIPDNWKETNGIFLSNFVPCADIYSSQVDITMDRYGYSGDVIVLKDKYYVDTRMVKMVLTGNENWVLDDTSSRHVFVLSGTRVVPSMGNTLVPDIYCDLYHPVAAGEMYANHNHITISNNGEICILDLSAVDYTLNQWKAKLATEPVTIVFPVLEKTTYEACEKTQNDLSNMVGYEPTMYISTDDKTNPTMELVYKLRVDTE